MSAANSQDVKDENQRPPEFAAKFVSAKFLLTFGLVVNGLLIIEGIICFSVCVLNVRSYILSFYYILFGLLTICAEYKFKFIAKHAQILLLNTGRGFWYLFLGTLALGREWWGIIVAILLIVVGLLNICAGINPAANIDKNKQDEEDMEGPLSDQDGNKWQMPSSQQISIAQKVASSSQDISQNLKPLQRAYDDPHEQQPGNRAHGNNAYDD